MGYAVRITTHAVDVVTGADKSSGIVAAESTSISTNLRMRFGSGDLRLRPGGAKERVVRQGNGWVVEGGSPYGSYAGTPVSGTFGPGSPLPSASPYTPSFPGSPNPALGSAGTPRSPSFGLGIGLSPHMASPRPPPQRSSSLLSPHTPGSGFPTAATVGTPYSPSFGLGARNGTPSAPNTPGLYAHFPPTPTPGSGGSVFAAQQRTSSPPPPPPRAGGSRSVSNGSANGSVSSGKKDD